jgi:cytochrome c oxidase assembly factor CtaG
MLLLATAAVFAVGVSRAGGRGRMVTGRQVGCFAAALLTLAVALLPPLAERADQGLVAHMVQHVLLLVVAAPLLALAAPVPILLRALPGNAVTARPWRRLLRSHARRWLAWVSATFVVSALVMVAWHLPPLYEGALHHEPVHALEHLSFLLTAAAFWWAVGLGAARPRGGAVAAVFVAALPGTALGAALTLARTPWYADYPSLPDQQLAGVVMWGFAGLAYVLAAAVVFGMWLRALERDAPARPEPRPATRVAV